MDRRYSILLPTFNSKKYIQDCVESVLLQSYPHFTLHVVDGFSQDETLDYIRSLQDERIRIHTSEHLLSIEENWKRFVSIAKNEFMTVLGHDDVLCPDYLKIMNALVERYPDASLYQTHFTYIDKDGLLIRHCLPMKEIISGSELLQAALSGSIDIMATGFMMRSKDYDEIGGVPLFPKLLFADDALWIQLTKKSYLATAKEIGFSFRYHKNTSNVLLGNATLKSLDVYVRFLENLKSYTPGYREIIERLGAFYIYERCREIGHRILRKPLKERYNLTVQEVVKQCTTYANILSPGNGLSAYNNKSMILANLIDSNNITRTLFILFKKIFARAILK